MSNPRSPVPGIDLEGYAEDASVPTGRSVALMLSGAAREVDLSLVRLIHGDPNPEGPGYREERVAWGQPERVAVTPQPLRLGSYVEVPSSDALNPFGSFTLALWILPTALTGGWHGLVSKWKAPELSYTLCVTGAQTLVAGISRDGVTAEWCTGLEQLSIGEWQFVALTFEAESGELTVHQRDGKPQSTLERSRASSSSGLRATTSTKHLPAGAVHRGAAPLWVGAVPDSEGGHWAHFNGKIAAPILLGNALSPDRIDALVLGRGPGDTDEVLAAWDFSRQVGTSLVIDISAHRNDGFAANCPARAVRGPRWRGSIGSLYSDDPADYDAIHFHDDDLADACWDPTLMVSVPDGTRPGIYAARLQERGDELFVPFVVRRSVPESELGFLVPTLTWQAYASNRHPYSHTEDGLVDEGLCIYDVHSDGSPVFYATWRKPTRSHNPRAAARQWGSHNLTANLYLIDWLEHEGFAYEAFTDHDLHHQGLERLAGLRCLVLGSHPEYWTEPMLDALEGYLAGGGRVLYLSGNGLYWVSSLSSEAPHIMEVRKSGDGEHDPGLNDPGEMQHSFTAEIGGLWARRGRPSRRYVGVEHAANVFVHSAGRWGFVRAPASYEPGYAFLFDGIGDETIGDFGLNLGSAAAYEMDAVQDWPWQEGWEPVVLARAHHESFIPPMRMPAPATSDIALIAAPNGAAVFAAGSVAWTGSLSHNDYDNNVARITRNALERFLAAPPGRLVLDDQPAASTRARVAGLEPTT